jgi:golgi-specific brefeldin A-resistance guanine nucleotide exchange factor 1
MNSTNLLVPPTDPDIRTEHQRALWEATQERVERFLPGFLHAVIPAPLPSSLPQATRESTSAA